MLDVVDQKMRAFVADAAGDSVDLGRRCAQAVGDRREDEVWVAERSEWHEERASFGLVREQAGELEREPRLAGAVGADDRQHTWIAFVEERNRFEELPLAAEKAGRRRRQVDASRRPKRREVAVPELA